MTHGIATQYRFAQESFVALVRTLPAEAWSTPVPCTPGWTVRDVLSHVAGVPDDALAGRVDGVTTDPWTAAQVERNRSLSVDELLGRWSAQTPGFADVLENMGERRAAIDCHSHEHDVRHAIGRPGNRDSIIIESAAAAFSIVPDCPVALDVTTRGRSHRSGPDGPAAVTLARMSPFELFRSRLGRRSRAQMRAWDWSGDERDIEAVIGCWPGFGPTLVDIVE